MSKKGLGRGFDSLIPTDVLDETFDPTASSDGQISELRYIQLSEIIPNPDQPRRKFDEVSLQELADSIITFGVLQPIVVAPRRQGFVIIAGERRWRAAGLAGLRKIPALVRTATSQHKLELALIENLQREDLNPMEMATAYLKLKNQFNLTNDEIGKRVGGRSSTSISNIVRLLQLPDYVKYAIAEGTITEGHGRQLLALHDDLAAQRDLFDHIVEEDWSVRKAEQYVIGYKNGNKKDGDAQRVTAVRSTRTQTKFTEALANKLSLPVVQKTTAKGGQIIISYKSEKDLDNLKKLLF
ncbi:ParB/RepB/Spo0J family partition protein [Candidatus Saccharibacteria bacterium]|nr:ParB/RepB/Spo0J family partition protein [Candidatus Saccharibacteria bacterium]NCU40263.1 ParB/RepB/Spo0J family partition protein [Candidatus Saccharibacteria bacterium]